MNRWRANQARAFGLDTCRSFGNINGLNMNIPDRHETPTPNRLRLFLHASVLFEFQSLEGVMVFMLSLSGSSAEPATEWRSM